MKSSLEQLRKDTIIYGIGQIALGGVGFFLLPVYTRVFTPVDYGTIEILSLTMSFWGMFLAMGTGAALNFYFHKEIESKARVVTAIMQWHLIWGVGLVTVTTITWSRLNSFLFRNELVWYIFAVAMAGTLLSQIIGIITDVFRLTHRPWLYVGITVCSSLTSVVVSLILVMGLNLGVMGVFAGCAVGAFVGVLVGWFSIHENISWHKWHCDLWPKLLKFGVPLVPASIATYFLNSADRWFINYYLTSADVGIYAVGAKFALFITMLMQIFMKAFMPFSMDLLHGDRAEMDKLFEVIFRYYGGISVAIIITITGASPYIVQILAPPEYSNAFKIIGILAMSGIFFGGTYFSSLGTWKVEKTYLYSLSTFIALVTGLVLNALLIKAYGLIGASVATAIAMFTLVATSFYFSQKLWRIDFNIPLALTQTLICVSTVIVFLLSAEGLLSQTTAYLWMGIGLGVLVLMLVKLPEALALLRLLRRIRQRAATP